MTPREKFDKAQALLLRDNPFWGSLVLNLKVQERSDLPVKTLATDGVSIMYDPSYVERQDLSILITDIAHETGHVMFFHNMRRGQRDPKVWNIAGDYVVNDFLVQSGFKLGSDFLYDPAYHGMDIEKIYNLLIQNPEKQPKDSCGCGGLHDHPSKKNGNGQDGHKDHEEQKPGKKAKGQGDKAEAGGKNSAPSTGQSEAQIRTSLAQARAFAKRAGKMPAELDEKIEQIINPRLNPEELIRQFLERCSADDYTWNIPSRHHQHLGLYLPSMSSEAIPEIVFVVDISASMIPASLIEKCAGWVGAATEVLPIHKVHVLQCDTKVQKAEVYNREDLPIKAFQPQRGGGTDFRPPFEWVAEQGIMPKGLIYLTDLECNVWPEQPPYPVLWVVYGNKRNAPIGEVVAAE